MTHRSKRTRGVHPNVNNTDSRIITWARNTLANPSRANYAPDMWFNFDYQRGFDDALHHIIDTFEKKN